MKARVLILAFGATAFLASPAMADCTCECVNGQMQPLCDRSIDLPPICPPTLCMSTGDTVLRSSQSSHASAVGQVRVPSSASL